MLHGRNDKESDLGDCKVGRLFEQNHLYAVTARWSAMHSSISSGKPSSISEVVAAKNEPKAWKSSYLGKLKGVKGIVEEIASRDDEEEMRGTEVAIQNNSKLIVI